MGGRSDKRDYSLIGRDSEAAVANGLATAEWRHTELPRRLVKELMRRCDGPAIWLGGLILSIIECPKHNGRFNYKTSEAKRAPVCVKLRTYPVRVDAGKILIRI